MLKAWKSCLLFISLVSITQAVAQTVDESATVVAVDIPVLVTAAGEPVRGLTADNFEIREDGEAVPIVGFQIVDVSSSQRVAGERKEPVLPASRRNLLLFFDLSFSNRHSLARSALAARDILSECDASDRLAVVLFVPDRGLVPVLSFTSDFRQVDNALRAVESLMSPSEERPPASEDEAAVAENKADGEDGKAGEAGEDPLGLVFSKVRSGNRIGLGLESRNGAAGDALMGFAGGGRGGGFAAEILMDMEVEYQRFNSRVRGNRVRNLAASMGMLAEIFRELQGQKYLVLFSEGFESSFAGRARRLETSANIVMDDLRKVLEHFRKTNWSIHAIDISNRNTSVGRGGGQSALFQLADDTGGKFYRNYNEPVKALANLLSTTSVTYILTIQPMDLELDGSYHPVKVRLKNAPDGARLVNRNPGFVAPKPLEDMDAMSWRARAADMIFSDREDGDLDLTVKALAMRQTDDVGDLRLPVIAEIGLASLREHLPQDKPVELEILAYAIDNQEHIADYFSQRVGIHLGKLDTDRLSGGVRAMNAMQLPPGDYRLRVLVRAGGHSVYALRTESVTLQSPSASPFMLQPLFPDLSGTWVEVKDNQANINDVFVVGERPFMPYAKPQVTTGYTIPVILVVENLEPGPVLFSHDVLSNTDDVMTEASFQLVKESMVMKDGTLKILGQLDTGDLPAGPYRLAVNLSHQDSGRTLSAEVKFAVKP